MYKLHLILKYLRKRRIAWVALIAVMLCTTMVLVVISVMGGWLRMFESSLQGMTGDVIVSAKSLRGFAYYPQLVDRLEKLPEVKAAVPVINTYGLLNIGKSKSDGVQVMGLQMDRIGQVNHFPQSLYYQYHQFLNEAAKPDTSPQRRKELLALAEKSAQHPGFDKRFPPEVYNSYSPKSEKWPGMIAGTGIIDIHKDKDGKIVGREEWKYLLPVKLVVMNVNSTSFTQPGATVDRAYWFVDDSHTGMWQYDSTTVYVPFDLLQKDLGLDEQQLTSEATGKPITRPARTTEVHVAFKPGVALEAGRDKVETVVKQLFAEMRDQEMRDGTPGWSDIVPTVQTWRQSQATFIGAIQNEKVLVVFLFGMISIVAIFLIFCIFYMIVAEKTRDIGIIKSVGASDGGVAAIFLGYGAAIGVVGGGMGFLLGYGIIHNINFLHEQMGKLLGIQIWKPEVYAFDTIPNRIDPFEATIIVSVAILASVAGAAVPAYRASRMHPIEALRWE